MPEVARAEVAQAKVVQAKTIAVAMKVLRVLRITKRYQSLASSGCLHCNLQESLHAQSN